MGKAVGLKKASSHAIGIAVDHRRRNRSIESLQTNVQRLKEYQANMILFPLNPKKPRKGDATPEEISKATQLVGTVMPYKRPAPKVEVMEITDELKSYKALPQSDTNVQSRDCTDTELRRPQ